MRFNQIPKKTDRAINFSNWENVNRQVKKLQNIKFDPFVFQTIEDPSGIYVTIQPSSGDETHQHRWTIENTSNSTAGTYSCVVGNGCADILSDVVCWNVGDGNVSGLALGDNLIYAKTQRDGGGAILMYANTNSNVMPTQSELGNNNFGWVIGEINTVSNVIIQHAHSDVNFEFPKTKPTEEPTLYQVVAL
jgi:hypothetical protein